jgi:glycosyltransferase involved in cell wall biosynthesis
MPGGEWMITPRFVDRFDMVIVVHKPNFIAENWDILRRRPTIWRTIGQGIQELEPFGMYFRRRGLKIVRWSPAELRQAQHAGQDICIRAYKDPDSYLPWEGRSRTCVLTFANAFAYRYPEEFKFYLEAIQGLDFKIGGGNNPQVLNSLGVVPHSEQLFLYRNSGAYFYCHGSAIPYTLNFVEAWMTGLPMVALHRDADLSNLSLTFNEVNDLLSDGETGFLARTPAEANARLAELIRNEAFANEISANARQAAIATFGKNAIRVQWAEFLNGIC